MRTTLVTFALLLASGAQAASWNVDRAHSKLGFHGARVEKLGALKGALKSALAATKDGKTYLLNVVLTR